MRTVYLALLKYKTRRNIQNNLFIGTVFYRKTSWTHGNKPYLYPIQQCDKQLYTNEWQFKTRRTWLLTRCGRFISVRQALPKRWQTPLPTSWQNLPKTCGLPKTSPCKWESVIALMGTVAIEFISGLGIQGGGGIEKKGNSCLRTFWSIAE